MFKSYISLEVRILLLAGVKTFCACTADEGGHFGSCPVCRGEGGARPEINPLALQKAYLLIRGLGGAILREASFERNLGTRKLPEGHDISRLSIKLGAEAAMDIMFHRRKKRIGITEIRLEEDAGRLIRQNITRMDYSRAGMPSLRIKTAADFEIGEEAEVFLSDLRRRIQYLEIIPPYPAESVIRCNAYVAMAPYPAPPVNFVKLRNLNSFNFVYKAVNAELSRQEEIVTQGGTVISESRIWNEAKNATESFQTRAPGEPARFAPVDTPPFIPGPDVLEAPGNTAVELPEARRNRVMGEYGLTQFQAEFVCDEKSRADYFEQTAAMGASPRESAQWMASYVVKEWRRLGFTSPDTPLCPRRFAEILKILKERRIHGSIAKQIITAVLREDRDPEIIIKERGWEQLTDRKALAAIVASVIEANPQEVR
ncbi:MAG: glutamyl-tRNA amidotransferase, partial [Treponema sp.]|nr:glutamyl-tRNA amidotransferase [Treponema sp.]